MERSLLVKEVLACIAQINVGARCITIKENMKQQDKEMFGENNEVWVVIGHALIYIFYLVALPLIAIAIYKCFL